MLAGLSETVSRYNNDDNERDEKPVFFEPRNCRSTVGVVEDELLCGGGGGGGTASVTGDTSSSPKHRSSSSSCLSILRPPAFLVRVRPGPLFIEAAAASTFKQQGQTTKPEQRTADQDLKDKEEQQQRLASGGVVDYDCFLEEQQNLGHNDNETLCLFPPPQEQQQKQKRDNDGDSSSSILALEEEENSNDARDFFPDLVALRYWSHKLWHQQLPTMPSGGEEQADDQFWDRTHQGILWKRRDIFRNRWRPRWFVLQPRQGLLTYYLFSSSDGVVAAEQWDTATQTTPVSHDDPGSSRDRAVSYDSAGAQTGIISDLSQQQQLVESIVPRGTIYLPGCRIERNDSLSRVEEQLFAWTIHVTPGALSTTAASITSASSSLATPRPHQVFLAARTAQARQIWMQQLARVCQQQARMDHTFINTDSSRSQGDHADDESESDQEEEKADDEDRHNPFARRLTPPPSSSLFQSSEHPQPVASSVQHSTPRRTNSEPIPSSPFRRQTQVAPPVIEERQASSCVISWEPVTPRAELYEGVPNELRDLLEQRIEANMPMLLADHGNEPAEWKPYHEGGTKDHTAVQTRTYWKSSKNMTLVHTTAEFPTLDPIQLFHTLIDHQQRPQYESSCSTAHRLHKYNPHTLLDAYQYASSILFPRTLACVVHWRCCVRHRRPADGGPARVLSATGFDDLDDKAILMVAASCSQASQKWEQHESHNKSTATESNLFISMALLRPSQRGGGAFVSRLVALDPKVPGWAQGMAHNFFVGIQAKLPKIMSGHILATSVAAPNGAADISDEYLRGLVSQLRQNASSSKSPQAKKNSRSISSKGNTEDTSANVQVPKKKKEESSSDHPIVKPPPVHWQAACLLAPTLLYYILRQQHGQYALLKAWLPGIPNEPYFSLSCFIVAVWWSLRQWVLAHYQLAPSAPPSAPPLHLLESITCQFSVHVKGSLRYITNHKEEQQEMRRSPQRSSSALQEADDEEAKSVSVVHIVASAVARVWSKHVKGNTLKRHRLKVPWLALDCWVLNPSKNNSVTVGIVAPQQPGAAAVVLVPKADQLSVQEIARCHKKRKTAASLQNEGAADCAVVLAANYPSSTSSSNDSGEETATIPVLTSDTSNWQWTAIPKAPSTPIVVVIGGLTFESTSNSKHPQPVLSLSVTIRGHEAAALKLIPELQTLLQFPEMCDP